MPVTFLGLMASDAAARQKYAVAVYDFRAAPEDIMDSLRWIAPPNEKK
jgi:hypothetical protein